MSLYDKARPRNSVSPDSVIFRPSDVKQSIKELKEELKETEKRIQKLKPCFSWNIFSKIKEIFGEELVDSSPFPSGISVNLPEEELADEVKTFGGGIEGI